jgi:hypothetical protein
MPHITFIHGISNKPAPNVLLATWVKAMFSARTSIDIEARGITCEMVYWADVLNATSGAEENMESTIQGLEAPESSVVETPKPKNEYERAWLIAMEQKLDLVGGKLEEGEQGLERIPLPGNIKNAFMKRFLRDVHHYLFNEEFSPREGTTYKVQDEIRARTIAALNRAAEVTGPHILVTHSMGTVIGYDCLKRVAGCPKVDAFVTLGSPLGIDEVQDQLRPEWSRDHGFPGATLDGQWINIFDKLDIVSRLDPYLASDYRRDSKQILTDVAQRNSGLWRHDIIKYLSGDIVSSTLASLLR